MDGTGHLQAVKKDHCPLEQHLKTTQKGLTASLTTVAPLRDTVAESPCRCGSEGGSYTQKMKSGLSLALGEEKVICQNAIQKNKNKSW